MKKYIAWLLAIILILEWVPFSDVLQVNAAKKNTEMGYSEEFMKETTKIMQENWEDDYFSVITMEVGEPVMIVDGEEKDCQPIIEEEGELLFPLQEIAKETGAEFEEEKDDLKDLRRNAIVTPQYTKDDVEDLGLIVEEHDDKIMITNPYQTKQIILKTVNSEELEDTYNAKNVVKDDNGIYFLQYKTEEATQEAYKKYQDDDNLEYSTLNKVQYSTSLSWGTDRISTKQYTEHIKSNGATEDEILVGVVDTGIEYTHGVLENRIREDLAYDYINYDNVAEDGHGHGTHVSGTVVDNSSENVKIIPIKVLADDGYGTTLSVSMGIYHAANNGAKVVNLSVGGPAQDDNDLDYQAIKAVTEQGVVCVAAAGNESMDVKYSTPARSPYAITVAATDSDDLQADFSNFGEGVDISAPGVNINSSYLNGTYIKMSGTSMATPHVSAAAALVLMESPKLSPEQVKKKLVETTVDCGIPGKDIQYGAGVLDFRLLLGEQVEAESLSLSLSSIEGSTSIDDKDGWRLHAVVQPANATDKSVTYESSNPDIAVYEGGKVYGKSAGEAVITASISNGVSQTCDVRIIESNDWMDDVADAFDGGDGSKENPYQLATAKQLAKLARDINSGDEKYSGKYFRQTADIDLKGKNWVPIGYREDVYTHWPQFEYDGGGFEIRNMKIETQRDFSGFFALNEKVLKNIKLVDADVKAGSAVGGLVGKNVGDIANCYVGGKVSGIFDVGGIAGESYSINSFTILDCYSDAEVSNEGHHSLGGLVGSLGGDVYNSYFTGTLNNVNGYGGGIAGTFGCWDREYDMFDVYEKEWSTITKEPFKIVNCFSSGPLVDTKLNGLIANSYYGDGNKPCRKDQNPALTNAQKKELSLFQSESTYGNGSYWDPTYPWDFDACWSINDGEFPQMQKAVYGSESTDFGFVEFNGFVKINKYKGSKTDVIIPETINNKPVKLIDEYTFNNATIQSIYFPENLIYIAPYTIASGGSLKNFYMNPDNPYYTEVDGVIFSKDKSAVILYPMGRGDKEYTLPDGVKSIESYAFNKTSLEEIKLPEGLLSIQPFGFYYNRKLTNIMFSGDAPRYFSNETFSGYHNDMTLYFQEGKQGFLYPKILNYPTSQVVVGNIVGNPPSGILNKGSEVTLTTTIEADIIYTTDGTDPILTSRKYTNPLVMNEDTVIKAATLNENNETGETATFTYKIFRHAEEPVITKQPEDLFVKNCETALLSVEAQVGNGELSYQWYKIRYNRPSKIEGATKPVYDAVVNNISTYRYYCVITNTDETATGNRKTEIKSDVVEVGVMNYRAPSNLVTDLDVARAIDIDACMYNDEGKTSAELSYQWYKNEIDSNSDGTQIDGAVNGKYEIPVDESGITYYYCVITRTYINPKGEEQSLSMTSETARVEVRQPGNAFSPEIEKQPEDSKVSLHDTVELSIKANVRRGTLSYQWYQSTDSSNKSGTKIENATESTYSFEAKEYGKQYYYCVVTNTDEDATNIKTAQISSEAVTVQVGDLFADPENGIIKKGDKVTLISYDNKDILYTTDGSVPTLSSTKYTEPIIVNEDTVLKAATVDSENKIGEVRTFTYKIYKDAEEPVITKQPEDLFVKNCETALLSVEAQVGNGELSYQWYKIRYTDPEIIKGATDPVFDAVVNNLSTYRYYCVITNTDETATGNQKREIKSDVVEVGVMQYRALGNLVTDIDAARTLDIDASMYNSEGKTSAEFSYQWYKNEIDLNSDGTQIDGAVNGTYEIPVDKSGITYYYCVITRTYINPKGEEQSLSKTSEAARVEVRQPRNAFSPEIEKQPKDCKVSLHDTVELSIKANVRRGILSYQWYQSTNSSNKGGTKIENATESTYSFEAKEYGKQYYYCVVTNTDEDATNIKTAQISTEAVTVQVGDLFADPENGIIKKGDKVTLTSYDNKDILYTTDGSVPTLSSTKYTEPIMVNEDTVLKAATVDSENKIGEVRTFTYKIYKDAEEPVITKQPEDLFVKNRETALLSVDAQVGNGELSYQWYKIQYNRPSKIEGATKPIFDAVVNNLSTYRYYCVITNTDEIATGNQETEIKSDVVEVGVMQYRALGNLVTDIDAARTLDIDASMYNSEGKTSAEFSYQWYKNEIDSNSDGTQIDGAVNGTYEIPVDESGITYYYCVITRTYINPKGEEQSLSKTSEAARVEVRQPRNAFSPEIEKQPEDSKVSLHDTVELSIKANVRRGILSYQWYQSTDSSNKGGTKIENATKNTYSFEAKEYGKQYYYCVVTNTDEDATNIKTAGISSEAVTVQVGDLFADPESGIIKKGDKVALTSYDNKDILYTTDGSVPTLSSTKYTEPIMVNEDTVLKAATVDSENKIGEVRTFIYKIYKDAEEPVITKQPESLLVRVREKALLHVEAEVGSGELSYQWYRIRYQRPEKMEGATEASFDVTPNNGETYGYYCLITNTDDSVTGNEKTEIKSDVVEVGVVSYRDPDNLSTEFDIPKSLEIDANIKKDGESYNEELSYQWYRNENNSNIGGIKIDGATNGIYEIPANESGITYYYCIITRTFLNTKGEEKSISITSKPIKAEVKKIQNAFSPEIEKQPENCKVYLHDTVELSVKAKVRKGTLSYQWYQNTSDSNEGGTKIESATQSTFRFEANECGRQYYYCIVTNTDADAANKKTAEIKSDAATVKVDDVLADPISGFIKKGEKVTLTSLCNRDILYTTDGTDPTTSSRKYTEPIIMDEDTMLKAATVDSENKMGEVITYTYKIYKDAEKPVITKQPKDLLVKNKEKMMLRVEAQVDSGELSYQWYQIRNNRPEKIEGAVDSSLDTTLDDTETYSYYCLITNTDNSATGSKKAEIKSDVVEVGVMEYQASDDLVTELDVAKSLEVNAYIKKDNLNDTSELSFQWYKNENNSNLDGIKIDGAVSELYEVPVNKPGVTYYYCEITRLFMNPKGEEKSLSITTESIRTEVKKQQNAFYPVMEQQPKDCHVSLNDRVELSVKANVQKGTLSYQWYQSTNSSNEGGIRIEGAVQNTFSFEAKEYGRQYYYCIVTNTDEDVENKKTAEISSKTATVQVDGVFADPTSGIIKKGEKVILTSFNNGDIFYTTDNSVPTLSSKKYTEPIIINEDTVIKAVTVDGNNEMGKAATFTYKIYKNAEEPVIIKQPIDLLIKNKEKAIISVEAQVGSGELSYQWYRIRNNRPEKIEGATQSIFDAASNDSETYAYYCLITNTDSSVTGNKKTEIKSDVVEAGVVDYQEPAHLVTELDEPKSLKIDAYINKEEGKDNAELYYQWYKNENDSNIDGMQIDGEVNAIYDVPVDKVGVFYYYCVITRKYINPQGKEQTLFISTNPIKVQVKQLENALVPTIVEAPLDQDVKVGDMVTLNIKANVKHGKLSYQWYRNDSPTNTQGEPIADAVNETFSFQAEEKGQQYYYCVVTNTDERAQNSKTATSTSDVVTVTISQRIAATPVITKGPEDAFIKDGENVILRVEATVDSGELSYQWYQMDSGNNVKELKGATQAHYQTTINDGQTYRYYCEVTNTDTSSSVKSESATVSVLHLSVLQDVQTDIGKAVKLDTGAYLMNGNNKDKSQLSFQWYQNNSRTNKNGIQIDSAVHSEFNVPVNQTGSAYYYCEITKTSTDSDGKTHSLSLESNIVFVEVKNKEVTPPADNTVKGMKTLKVTAATYNTMKLNWSKLSGVNGYEIYRGESKTGKYKLLKDIKTGNTTTIKDTKCTLGKTYYYKVRAYKNGKGKKVYGTFSKIVSGKTQLAKPKLVSVRNLSKGTAKLGWKKVSGAQGYEIYRSDKKNGKYKKVKTVKGIYSHIDKKLKKNKSYFYKVRAYRKVGNKVYRSAYSIVKGVKIKK